MSLTENRLQVFFSFSALKRRLKSALPQGKFARSVVILSGGTALGQGLTILASPVLSRLYTPLDFGLASAYASIGTILLVVACLRYELAIPLPGDDESAVNLLALAIIIVLGMGLVIGIVVWLLGDQLVRWGHIPALRPYLWLLPLSILGAGVYQALNYWAVRKNAFSRIAKTSFNRNLGQVATQIGTGLFALGPLGLLLGDVVGRVGGSGTLATLAWRQDRDAIKRISAAGIREVASRYRRFPLLASGSALLNTAGLQMPALLLAMLYGVKVAGWFALSQRIIGFPLVLIGHSVAQVYIGEASRLVNTEPEALRGLFLKTLKKLSVLGLAPILALAFLGPKIFAFVFGSSWSEAGLYAQLLSAMFLVQFAVMPVSQTLNILERQDWQLVWDAGRLIIVVASITLTSVLQYSASVAIMLYGIAMLFAYLILLYLSYSAINKRLDSTECVG